jgi:6-phosphogluconolactonase (cycloisomerase 2 family)
MRSALRVAPVLLLILAACGSSSSPAPTITTQPADAVVLRDIGADFAVVASNATSYQWRKNGADIAGATAASYTTPATVAADDHAVYSVVVSGKGGSATSANAALRVVLPPAITAAPTDTAVLDGGAVHLAVSATGNGTISYQWSLWGNDIAGATGPTFDLPAATPADSGEYGCQVTNTIGAVQSPRAVGPAVLAVVDMPVITLQPVGATLVPGDPWTLKVAATASFNGLTFQWQKDGAPLPGATSDTYVIPSSLAGDGGSYTCVVSNVAGVLAQNVTSDAAVLTMWLSPVILAQPGARSAVTGQTATFRVAAKGAGTLTYRWYKGATAIPGAAGAGATYTTPAAALADNGASFHVVVSNGTLPNAVSANASLSVTTAVAGLSASRTTISAGEGVVLSYVIPTGTATLTSVATPLTGVGTVVVFPTTTTTYVLQPSVGSPSSQPITVQQYTPKFLFVANSGSDDLSTYAVDLASATVLGDPGPTTPAGAAGAAPIHLATSPDEHRLYVSNSGDGTVSAFDVDGASGALTAVAGSPFQLSSATAAPWASAVNPAGTRLYVACAEGIEVFTIDAATGALTRVAGQAVSIPGRVRGDLLINPSGRALYVADAGHARVKGYAIAANGALTFAGDAPAGIGASGMALDASGTVLFVRGDTTVPTYNGQLDAIAIEADGALGVATRYAGYGPVPNFGDMPFVRGTTSRHSVATSRRPDVNVVFNSYDGEVSFTTVFSGYEFDRAGAAITQEFVGKVAGDLSSPFFQTNSMDLVMDGDSVVVDRSGALIACPIATYVDRLYAWTQGPSGAILPVGDPNLGSFHWSTGSSPAHAAFTGTLQ